MIIGISGKIGSGKDTVGKLIQQLSESRKWEIKKFALKLKQVASLMTGVPVEKFEDQDFKKVELGKEWSSYVGDEQEIAMWGPKPMTVREFLQRLGTDAVRDNLHINAWVNALFADYKESPENILGNEGYKLDDIYPNWIITDTRFPNEAQAIKDRGGIVLRVIRPGMENSGNHPSETALDNWPFDYVIENDGTIEDLSLKVAEFLYMFKLLNDEKPS